MKNFIEISDENEITLLNINHIVCIKQHAKKTGPSIHLVGKDTISPIKHSYEDLLEMIRKAEE